MLDSEQVTITVRLTQKDYATALRELAKHRTGWAKRVLFWISVAFLGCMVYFVLRDSETPFLNGVMAVVGVAMFLLFVLSAKLFGPWLGGRQFVKKNPDKLGPSKVSVNADGVNYESPHANAASKWSAYPRIMETMDLFLFYTQSNFAQILPKRCFENPNEIESLRKILTTHYKGKLELLV
jgi:hypothetical protein